MDVTAIASYQHNNETSPLVIDKGSPTDLHNSRETLKEQRDGQRRKRVHCLGLLLAALVLAFSAAVTVHHFLPKNGSATEDNANTNYSTLNMLDQNNHENYNISYYRDTIFPELIWDKACPNSGYDFVGTLQFCQVSSSTKKRKGKSSNNEYGYRLHTHDDCKANGVNPLIRVQPGFRYQLRLENHHPQERTNIHPHGLHLSGSGNADDITRIVEPGNVLLYNWSIPAYHSDGTFWYHSHAHGIAKRQVNGGAYGILMVDPQDPVESSSLSSQQQQQQPMEEEGEEYEESSISEKDPRPSFLTDPTRERLLLLSTMRKRKRPTHYANGQRLLGKQNTTAATTFALMPNVWYRLRIVVADVHAIVRDISFDPQACQVRSLAHDGIWRSTVPSSLSKHVYRVTGSSRLDVALLCQQSSGIWYNVSSSSSSSPTGGTIGSSTEFPNNDYVDRVPPLVRLEVQENPDGGLPLSPEPLETWIPSRPPYLQVNSEGEELTATTAATTFEVNMTSKTLNGLVFDASTPLHTFDYGSSQLWKLVNSSAHPFHLHTYPMQVVSPGGCGYEFDEGEWFDTISSQKRNDANDNDDDVDIDDTCLVRFGMRGFGGRIIFHCHMLSHEDAGVMGWVNVVGGPEIPIDNVEQVSLLLDNQNSSVLSISGC